jgi:hypothetical protein
MCLPSGSRLQWGRLYLGCTVVTPSSGFVLRCLSTVRQIARATQLLEQQHPAHLSLLLKFGLSAWPPANPAESSRAEETGIVSLSHIISCRLALVCCCYRALHRKQAPASRPGFVRHLFSMFHSFCTFTGMSSA